MADTFLEAVLVIEVGNRIAVGACGGLLAQLGATVIVSEPAMTTTRGKWRNRAAMLAGKESWVVGTDAAERQRWQELIAVADMVLLSTDDGDSDPTAWDATRSPQQIVCDITSFGHDGPLAGRGGSEAIVAALSGVLDTTGLANGPPQIVGAPVLEMSAAVFAASAAVAALRVRRLRGFGQRLDIAVFDTAVNELANFLPLHFEGRRATRAGNRHPLHVPWGSYPARDGYILICTSSLEQFARLCEAICAPEMATDARYATPAARSQRVEEIDSVIEAWTRERTVAQCEAELDARGVACGPIVPIHSLQSEPNLRHRNSLQVLQDPETGGRVVLPATTLRGKPVGGVSPAAIPARDSGRQIAESLIAARRGQGASRGPNRDGKVETGALVGVRVIEIGQHTVAPLASRHLGALGADVIKIESPGGDAIRYAPPLRVDGLSHIFAISNTDKRGLVLDLRDAAQKEMLQQLLAEADVLIENMRPGALAKLGFGADVLRERYPKLIYCSINGFGNDSAYPGRRALDSVIQAMSGLMSLTKAAGVPLKAGISVSDMMGGEMGMLGALAALEYRDRTGRGVHLDLSMQESTVWMTQIAWRGSAPPTDTFVCAAPDGFVVAEATAGQVEQSLGSHFPTMNRNAMHAALVAAGIDSAPVLSVHEVAESAHVTARKLLLVCRTSDGDSWTVLGCPLRLEDTPAVVRKAMPRLGAEDASIIEEFRLRNVQSGAQPARKAARGEA